MGIDELEKLLGIVREPNSSQELHPSEMLTVGEPVSIPEQGVVKGSLEGQNPDVADTVNAIVESPNAPKEALPTPTEKAVNEETVGRAYPTPEQKAAVQPKSLEDKVKMLDDYKKMKPKKEKAADDQLQSAALADALATFSNIVNRNQVGEDGRLATNAAQVQANAIDNLTNKRKAESEAKDRKEREEAARKLAEKRFELTQKVQLGQVSVSEARNELQREEQKLRKERQEKLDAIKLDKEDRLQGKDNRQEKREVLAAARQALKDDKTYDKLTAQNLAFKRVDFLLQENIKGNELALSAVGPQLARALGEVGVLTDIDVTRYLTGKSIKRDVTEWISQRGKGKLSKEAQIELARNITKFREDAKNSIRQKFNDATKGVSSFYQDTGVTQNDLIRGLGADPSLFPELYKKEKTEENQKEDKIEARRRSGKKWLEENPNHPKAKEIRKRLGL